MTQVHSDLTLVDEGVVTIPQVLRRAAELWPDAEAIVDGDRRMTFSDLRWAAGRAGNALIALGVQPGDRVAIWAPNSLEWIVALLGIYRSGAALVPVNTRYRLPETEDIIRRSQARVVIAAGRFLGSDYADEICHSEVAGQLAGVVALSESQADCHDWVGFLAKGDVEHGLAAREEALRYESTSDVLFTSGTTGSPKGAVLIHGASVRAFDQFGSMADVRAGDRAVVIPPFFHGFGLKAAILTSLCKGATLIPVATFDPDETCDLIESERVSWLPAPPTVIRELVMRAGGHESIFATLRTIVTGSDRLPKELLCEAKTVLGLDSLVTGYGLTEATVFATHNWYDDPMAAQLDTIGPAVPGTEIQILRDDNSVAATNEPGEICIRGYTVMKEYLDDPVSTAKVIDADGWLHTGDLGELDGDGRVRFRGRKKDIYIVGGFNVYPAEVEKMLLEHEGVADAAVIGVPDARLGEVGAAFLIPSDGETLKPEAVIAFARERMANFKVPRYVEICKELPRTASGKVQKHRLKLPQTTSR